MAEKIRSYDFFGNIAVVRFPNNFSAKEKKKFSVKLMKEQKSVQTVLEKVGKIKGRLRKIKTKYVSGERTKEVLYKENNCVFRFNIDSTYFSPRLSNERKEIAGKIKQGENVLVMFAGVAPFSIVIAKNSRAIKVVSVEINREASKYAKLNVELNKLKNKVEVIQGDVKKVAVKLAKKEKFDVIVMPRPQLKESFLKEAFKLCKRGTKIYYYGFGKEDEINLIVEKIKSEADKYKSRIKILKVKKAGEIAPYKYRFRVDFKVI